MHLHRWPASNTRWHFTYMFILRCFVSGSARLHQVHLRLQHPAEDAAGFGKLWRFELEEDRCRGFICSYQVLVPLFQSQLPGGHRGMLRNSLGLVESSMGHWWLHFLVFLRGHKVPFSSSSHPLEKVNFNRDELTLARLGSFSPVELDKRWKSDV